MNARRETADAAGCRFFKFIINHLAMLLYLLRHANADTPAPADDDRTLSEKGHAQAGKVARFCKTHGIKISLILTSPLRRAHQTAQPVADALNTELRIAPWLESGMQPRRALEEMGAYRMEENLMIVGHEPDFSELAAHLLGLPANSAIHIGKGSLTLLDVSMLRAGAASLQFSLPCKLM